jgi:APA family basic amino acid/polyamine antiporter
MKRWLSTRCGYRKPIEDVQRSLCDTPGELGLKRVLGPLDLILIGVGVIVGGGIFVVTGSAAALYAGPAIVFSFLLAGLACALTGMCYAELAAMIPASGSAYTYAYTAFGEVVAWVIGWNLLLEYTFAASYVSVGWSGYLTSLLAGWGLRIPGQFAAAPFLIDSNGFAFTGALVNAPAAALAVTMAFIAARGVRLSTLVNSAIVLLKISALLLVVAFGIRHIRPANWVPFLPPNDGSFGHFGVSGVLRGAAVVFVSYLGFDAIAALAQDTRQPQRDLPIGILGSLTIATLLYAAAALVLTGLAPYATLNTASPISTAILAAGSELKWLIPIVDVAAIIGLGSVVLVIMLAQPRILLAMGRDRLIPPVFARLHSRYRTPFWGTAVCGLTVAVLAGLFPLSILVQLVSIGTLAVFITVSAGVLILRSTERHRARPYRTPFVPAIPVAGMLVCCYLLVGIAAPTWCLYAVWTTAGMAVYMLYGRASAAKQRARVIAQN